MSAGSCVVPTNALLRDGVRPSVVAKHLVGQADHTVSLYVTHLVEGETEAGLSHKSNKNNKINTLQNTV